jgi:hypothetical protein
MGIWAIWLLAFHRPVFRSGLAAVRVINKAGEATLLLVLYPHLLSALAFVHAQRAALARVQDFVRKPRRSPATANNIERRRGD